MIQAEDFIDVASDHGFATYAGVPCSFLTPFINYVINDDSLNYICSANEGDAVAIAAGAAMGGQRAIAMMQNSGLGNAVSPLTSLTYVFRIPILIICTHRGAPGLKDEPQHELMGKITTEQFDLMCIPWEYFPTEAEEIGPALQRATDYMQKQQRPYALIMKKGTVAGHELKKDSLEIQASERCQLLNRSNQSVSVTRQQALSKIIDHTPENDTVVLATTGFTGRELFAVNDRKNQIYMVGSMGCVSSWGLGLSLARPDLNVVAVEGDGAALMRMGNFSTIGAYAGSNFTHIVLDNQVHDSTGAQSTVSANVSFSKIAASCSYEYAIEGDQIEMLDELFQYQTQIGAKFAHLKTLPGTMEDLPRPSLTPNEVLTRLMQQIRSSF